MPPTRMLGSHLLGGDIDGRLVVEGGDGFGAFPGQVRRGLVGGGPGRGTGGQTPPSPAPQNPPQHLLGREGGVSGGGRARAGGLDAWVSSPQVWPLGGLNR